MSLSKKYKGVNLLELSEDELEALIFADSENEENISSSDESFVGAVYSDDEIEDDVLDLPTGPSPSTSGPSPLDRPSTSRVCQTEEEEAETTEG